MKRQPTLIIAEAGVNHSGSLETALALVDAAADAGADIVKFQTFNANSLAGRSARKADYQRNTYPNCQYPEMYIIEGGYKNFFSQCPVGAS